MELCSGNDSGSHAEKSVQRSSDELQNQLTQVTDELNQLKMQLASPPLNDSSKDIPYATSHCKELTDSNSSVSVSYSSHVTKIEEQSSSAFASSHLDDLDDNEDKDKQIRILSNKLLESNKQLSEQSKEIERLRDIIKQRNG